MPALLVTYQIVHHVFYVAYYEPFPQFMPAVLGSILLSCLSFQLAVHFVKVQRNAVRCRNRFSQFHCVYIPSRDVCLRIICFPCIRCFNRSYPPGGRVWKCSAGRVWQLRLHARVLHIAVIKSPHIVPRHITPTLHTYNFHKFPSDHFTSLNCCFLLYHTMKLCVSLFRCIIFLYK